MWNGFDVLSIVLCGVPLTGLIAYWLYSEFRRDELERGRAAAHSNSHRPNFYPVRLRGDDVE